MKALRTGSSPSMSSRHSATRGRQNPSSHISILRAAPVGADSGLLLVVTTDMQANKQVNEFVVRSDDDTHRLPLSSPTLHPLPPRQRLQRHGKAISSGTHPP